MKLIKINDAYIDPKKIILVNEITYLKSEKTYYFTIEFLGNLIKAFSLGKNKKKAEEKYKEIIKLINQKTIYRIKRTK